MVRINLEKSIGKDRLNITLRKVKIAKEKKCEIKECEWVAKKFMKCGIKEYQSTNCFRKCGIRDCNPSIFCEMQKQKLQGFI